MKKIIVFLLLLLVAGLLPAEDFKYSTWSFEMVWSHLATKEEKADPTLLKSGKIIFLDDVLTIVTTKSETHAFYVDGDILFVDQFGFYMTKNDDRIILDPTGDNGLYYSIVLRKK